MSVTKITNCVVYPAWEIVKFVDGYPVGIPDWSNHICVELTLIDEKGNKTEVDLSYDLLEDIRPFLHPIQYDKFKDILEHNAKLAESRSFVELII